MPNELARVLLVDDRQDKLTAMDAVLDHRQVEAVKARSGPEALELSKEHDFAVILLDVQMPGMDGFQTAALLRQQPATRTTPIIFVSAVENEELIRKGYALGAVDYIRDIVPEILRTKVAVFVDLYKKATDLSELQRARRLLQVQYSVTRLFSEAGNPHDVLERVLQVIGESFSWRWCAWWGNNGQQLRCTVQWHDPAVSAEEIRALFDNRIFESCNLLERVRKTGESVWIPDIGTEKIFDQGANTAIMGRTAVAFPVTSEGELIGVIECFAPTIRPRDEIMVATLSGIGSHIGQAFAMSRIKTRKRAIIEASLDSIITVDLEDKILEWNPAAERTFGYNRKDALGRKMAELIVPERWRQKHRESIKQVIRTGRSDFLGKRLERPALRADGTEFPAEFVVTQIASDGVPLFTAYVRDITERRKAEKSLRETAARLADSNADLAQFAYVASHDLQEPLRAIAGCVQILQDRYADRLDASADQLINHAIDGARRMHTLIQDLLAYSRVGTEGKPFVSTDCAVILEGVLANLSAAIQECEAIVIHDPLPIVMADPTQMTQLFQNLISNAIKFCPGRRPEIHIAAERADGKWRFSVSDNGIGIPPQYSERIFLIFQRLHTRKEFSGSGIGLAMCKKIVERHGGRIWVESRPGEGSTFYFILPGNDQ